MCKHITIIGGGPAGISALFQIVELAIEREHTDIKITVVEKNKQHGVGPGLPYSAADDVHILNLPANVMSPIPEDPEHFVRWLGQNKDKWSEQFPKFDIATNPFPPRRLYGLYLKDLAEETRQRATDSGIEVDYVYEKAVNVAQDRDKSRGYFVTLAESKGFKADQVLLCIGHLPPSTFTEFKDSPGYHHQVWPCSQFEDIPTDDDILIAGTRLTAIDLVLYLKQVKKHKGTIHLVSRSGLLPAVIGLTRPYGAINLTPLAIEKKTAKGQRDLPLDYVIELFWKEMAHARGGQAYTEEEKQQLLKPKATAIEWLETQLSGAQQVRPWQSFLFSMFAMVPDIWSALSLSDKKRFLRDYNSIFMTYLAAFPQQNAEKMLSLLKSGDIKLHGGLESIVHDNQAGIYTASFSNAAELKSHHLLNATGMGHDIDKSGFALLANMVESGLLTPAEIGGVQADFITLQAINKNNKEQTGLYVVGELAWYSHLLTTDLGQVTDHVCRAVVSIMNNLNKPVSLEHNKTQMLANTMEAIARAWVNRREDNSSPTDDNPEESYRVASPIPFPLQSPGSPSKNNISSH